MLHKICGTSDHCFITTHSIYKEGDISQIYFCVIFHDTRHRTQAHCALSLAMRTQMAEQWVDFAGHCLLWLLLLRLAAVVSLRPQNGLLTSLAFAPDSEAVSSTRISLMVSSSSFIYFFPPIARDPQLSALFKLPCMTRHSFRNVIPVRLWMSSTVTAKQV